MKPINRRQALQLLGAAGAASAVSISGVALAAPVMTQAVETIGRVVRQSRGGLTVHTYVAPDASLSVTSHIIETAEALIVVDAQFLQTFARDVKAYADSLGKPIAALILSHGHPDHFLGANLFEGVPFLTTAAIAAEVQAYADGRGLTTLSDLAGLLGASEVPDAVRVPDGTLTEGETTIGGTTLTLSLVENAEATLTLLIGMPAAGMIIIQDLLYNGNHFFPGTDRDNWIEVLKTLPGALDGYDTLLVGHGLPSGKGGLDIGVQYLSFVQETLAGGADATALVAALEERYPAYEGRFTLTFWPGFLG